MMTALSMWAFAVLFMVIGGVLFGGFAAWIAYGMGIKKERSLHRPEKDWKKTKEVTYETK